MGPSFAEHRTKTNPNISGQTAFKYPVASELSHGNRQDRRRGPTPRSPGPVASQGCPVPGGPPGLEDGRRARLRGANSTVLAVKIEIKNKLPQHRGRERPTIIDALRKVAVRTLTVNLDLRNTVCLQQHEDIINLQAADCIDELLL